MWFCRHTKKAAQNNEFVAVQSITEEIERSRSSRKGGLQHVTKLSASGAAEKKARSKQWNRAQQATAASTAIEALKLPQ